MSFIDDLLQQTGQGATAELTGGAIGQIFGAMNDNRQLTQQRHLQNLQLEGQKGMMDYAYQKQLDMWNQTNYPAQMQQLEKAGLNPGLMYAKGGPGGVTGTPAGNVTGGQAQQNPGEATAAMGIMNQNALMDSQRKLIDAQANETNVRANKEAGVDTNVGHAQEQSLLQGINNQKAQEALTKVETEIANINKQVQGQTIQQQIDTITNTAKQSFETLRMATTQANLDQAQYENKIKMLTAQLAGQVLTNALTSAEAKNINQDTKNKIQELANDKIKWQALIQDLWIQRDQLSNQNQEMVIRKMLADNEILGSDAGESIGEHILNGIKAIIPIGIGSGPKTTPIKGFHQR